MCPYEHYTHVGVNPSARITLEVTVTALWTITLLIIMNLNTLCEEITVHYLRISSRWWYFFDSSSVPQNTQSVVFRTFRHWCVLMCHLKKLTELKNGGATQYKLHSFIIPHTQMFKTISSLKALCCSNCTDNDIVSELQVCQVLIHHLPPLKLHTSHQHSCNDQIFRKITAVWLNCVCGKCFCADEMIQQQNDTRLTSFSRINTVRQSRKIQFDEDEYFPV